jgi:serine/threonine-protein kinase
VSADPASESCAGTVVGGRYELVELLGRGGMGEVWRARHVDLGSEVAVKLLTAAAIADPDLRAGALERFHCEARLSAELGQRTDRIVRVHDAGSDATGPYLVMELCRGRTLEAVLAERRTLSPGVVASVLDQLAAAIEVAHAAGIVHRDLKPSNLMVAEAPDGALQLKVADFGVAKALTRMLGVSCPSTTQRGLLVGSPAYLSPEQIDGRGADTRSDLWAMGVLAYEALTGRLPFDGGSVTELLVAIATKPFRSPTLVDPDLAHLEPWFARALSKNAAERFGTTREMATAFRAALARRAPLPVPAPRRRWPLVVATAVGIAFGFGLALSLTEPRAAAAARVPLPEQQVEPAQPAPEPRARPAVSVAPTAQPTPAPRAPAAAPRRGPPKPQRTHSPAPADPSAVL